MKSPPAIMKGFSERRATLRRAANISGCKDRFDVGRSRIGAEGTNLIRKAPASSPD